LPDALCDIPWGKTVMTLKVFTLHLAVLLYATAAYGQTHYLPVTSFGAKGDGVTDDQHALQRAFDAGKSQGLPIYIPPGTYLHSDRLNVDSIVVFGAAKGQSVLKGTTYIKAAIDVRGNNPALYNLVVVGTGGRRSSDRGGNGIYISRSAGYIIKNVHVKGVSGAGIMTEHGENGKILNNLVEATGADGIYQTEGTARLEVAYNKTYRTSDDGISFTSYRNAGGFVHDIDVHHNSVLGNTESRSITVNGGYNIKIHNNHVEGGTAGISVGATTAWDSLQNYNVTVTNNVIKSTTFTGEGTIGGGAIHLYNNADGQDFNIKFSDNDIYAPSRYGIFVWGNNEIQADISNNRFYVEGKGKIYQNKNPNAKNINQSENSLHYSYDYPGDKISKSIGGIDPLFTFLPIADEQRAGLR
jgi:hypothetical protein